MIKRQKAKSGQQQGQPWKARAQHVSAARLQEQRKAKGLQSDGLVQSLTEDQTKFVFLNCFQKIKAPGAYFTWPQ